jgi:hypothetical protein
MSKRHMLAMASVAGLACSMANAQVIISEVVDGPLSGGNPKMLELTNVGTTPVTLGAGDVIGYYSNGATARTTLCDFGAVPSATSPGSITINPGQSWTLSSSGNGAAGQWAAAFGPSVVPSFFTTSFMGNGDDVYTLENAGGIVDVFGVPGQRPAVGVTWNYNDSFARRKATVCAPSATFDLSQWIFPGSDWMEIPNQNGAAAANTLLWTNNTGYMLSPNTHQNVCAGRVNDCNGNGLEDFAEITATPSLDVDRNGIPDTCDVQFGFATDCTGDLVPDVGQIETGTFPDTNTNGIPDGCEGLLFDCNGNFIEDATEILNGTEQDCNANNVPDSCELARGGLTDANANTVPDACSPDNAYVGETPINATVTATGVRSGPFGDAFFNVQGPEQVNTGNPPPAPGTNRSYGGLRFPIAAIAAKLDSVFGPGNWEVEKVYLVLTQSNAAFTAGGDVVAYHSNADTVSFANGSTTTQFDNFATDFPDAEGITDWTFTQVANGTVENHLLFDASVVGQSIGAVLVADEIESGAGSLTLVLKNADTTPTVSATYAGFTNNTYAGPTLVVFGREATGPTCPWQTDGCYADYNNDGGIDGDDVIAFFADWDSSNLCADADASEGVDGDDVIFFFASWDASGGGFPGC